MEALTGDDGVVTALRKQVEKLHDFRVNVYLLLAFCSGLGLLNLGTVIKFTSGH